MSKCSLNFFKSNLNYHARTSSEIQILGVVLQVLNVSLDKEDPILKLNFIIMRNSTSSNK